MSSKNGHNGKGCGKNGVGCTCQESQERIRQRAFEIYQARKGMPGDPAADWLQAERELSGKDAVQPSIAAPRRRLANGVAVRR